MHYFSPVEKMPLLEVVVTDQTSKEAEATAVAYGLAQGKTVIVVNDGPGFYTTRILGPYSAEAFHLLSEAPPSKTSARRSGVRIQSGRCVWPTRSHGIGAKISVVWSTPSGTGGSARDGEPHRRRGPRKNRRPMRATSPGTGGVDATVYADLGIGDRAHQPHPRSGGSRRHDQRGRRCLEEGVLRSAEDGDIGAVMGLGFPPFRGGPFFWIDQQGARRVVERLRALEERLGPRFTPAEILVEAAESGRSFR